MKKGLLLKRREGESCLCFVGQDDREILRVIVESIQGNSVRLRFVADDSVDILRSELVESK
jgi:sRNA-binding carbon storage regulator CsrA